MKTVKSFLRCAMLITAVVIGVGCLTSCSDKTDDPALPSVEEMEASLVGLWYEEFDYAGIVEDTGEAFTSAVLAMQVNDDYTGCLYAGAFNKGDYDNPLTVVGGPEEAGFTWQVDNNGVLTLKATDGSGIKTLAHTRADGSTGGDVRNLTSLNGWETKVVNGQTVVCRGSNVLTSANAEQTGRAMVGDAWVTLERDGQFPAMVEGPVTSDPGSTTWALKGQTLDKIIYINPKGGPQLKPLSFSIDSATYVRADGKTPLGDHAPVSAKFRFMP